MRFIKKILLLLFIGLLLFVGHLLVSTGFFRTIEPKFDGKILKTVALKGAEDIMISHVDSFALVSSTNRGIYPPNSEEKGGLYLIDLTTNDLIPNPLTTAFKQPFAPHGISFFKKDSSYQVMAVNHTPKGHSIEVFELQDKKMHHTKTLKHPSMVQPNDVVLIGENQFYFTNDHKYTKGVGKYFEEYSGAALSNVMFFDGNNFREVAKGIAYANGINYDRKRQLVYVASPRRFLIKVYEIEINGSLTYREDIPCGTGVDNIELDQEGNLWVGAHPNLLRFSAYAKGAKKIAPSEIIKINYRKKGDYSVEKIYVEDGQKMSGSTVAAPFGNLIFMGNVLDDKFLILEKNNSNVVD